MLGNLIKKGKVFGLDIQGIGKERALLICIIITVLVMLLEFWVGELAGSLMLISDGFHMLSHAASLLVTLSALLLARKWKSRKEGDSLPELIGALINGAGLIFFTVFIVLESLERLEHPEQIDLLNTFAVAVLGLMINLTTALILGISGVEDLNTRSAYLHMLADTFSSVVILLGLVIIHFTGWLFIDPVLSLVVAFVIAKWAYGLFRETFLSLRFQFRAG